MTGRIAEIFESIQGEGIYAGEKQIFVRLFGCNLKCGFCDTALNSFSEYTPQELLLEIKTYAGEYHSLAFTGGEPLLQPDFLKAILGLTKKSGYINYLETNGTLPEQLKEVISLIDIVAMDFKLPSSTGLGAYWESHREFLRTGSLREAFVKVVINQTTEEEDLRKSIAIIRQVNPQAVLVLQPDSSQDYGLLRDKIGHYHDLCRRENITSRIIPQMHKLAGIK